MKHNVGTADRIVRGVLGLGLVTSSIVAPPVPMVVGVLGGLLALTSLAGTCPGYRMLGRSTCPR
jgi:hypothetical protein